MLKSGCSLSPTPDSNQYVVAWESSDHLNSSVSVKTRPRRSPMQMQILFSQNDNTNSAKKLSIVWRKIILEKKLYSMFIFSGL